MSNNKKNNFGNKKNTGKSEPEGKTTRFAADKTNKKASNTKRDTAKSSPFRKNTSAKPKAPQRPPAKKSSKDAAMQSPKPPALTKEQKAAYHKKIKEEFVPISRAKYKRLPKAQKRIYRYQERVANPRKKALYVVKWVFGIIFGIFFVSGLVLSGLGFYWIATAPDFDPDNLKYIEPSRIYANDGTTLYQELQGSEPREIITIDQMPEIVQLAFVSIEDERFYTHQGIDLKGILKAGVNAITSFSLEGPGGSTITQQLIKLTHLSDAKSIERKVMEWKLSIEVEDVMTKEQILESYLNKINFSWAHGIEAASKTFFNKPAKNLTLSQACVLAAMPQAPSAFMPFTLSEATEEDPVQHIIAETDEDGNRYYPLNPDNQRRAAWVLDKMRELGHISQEEYDIAYEELMSGNVGLKPQDESESQYSYFTDALYYQVIEDLQEDHGYTEDAAIDLVLNGGLRIYATVDIDVQNVLEDHAAKGSYLPSQSWSAAAASEAKSAETGEEVNYIPQCAMVVIDNESGAVAGLVGGREKTGNLTINRALQKFQVGSATKPLTVYAPGLETHAITLATRFDDVNINVGGWRPTNSGGTQGGMTSVRDGLRRSLNIVAVQAWYTTGVETSSNYAKMLGLELDESDYGAAALSLGGYTYGQTALAMTAAYANFPNKGVYREPIMYTRITDRDGNLLFENKAQETQVFSEGTAWLITDVLKQVIKGGTTTISMPGDLQIAGKTGTTDEQRHAYMCGYTPFYTCSVWFGYDQNIVYANGNRYVLNIGVFGGGGPGQMFAAIMRDIHEEKDLFYTGVDFPSRPSDLISIGCDSISGKGATELSQKAGHVASDWGLPGTGPSGTDDFHQQLKICKVSGRQASTYCPADQVEEKIVVIKPDSRFPSGITAVDKNFIPSNEKDFVYIPLGEGDADLCKYHNVNSVAEIGLYSGSSRAPSSITLDANETVTYTVKGRASNGGIFELSSGITASSDNSNVANVSVSGNTITIRGVAQGNATISVAYTDTYDGKSVTMNTSIGVSVRAAATSPPQIQLSTSSITIAKNSALPDMTQYISSVTDEADGNINISRVTIDTSGINLAAPGSYVATYSVTNSLGLTGTATLNVVVTN